MDRWFLVSITALGRALLVLGLPAAYFAYVFRLPDGTLAESGLGDWIDPYFINFILEHWYYSISTLSDPRSPPMYFPVAGTLGYSHSLILYAPFYVVLRPFVDQFQAYTLALILVLETGSVCLYLLLRRLGLGLIEALALCAFFVTSANIINGGTYIWSQTASVFLIPPVLLILTTSSRLPDGSARLILAGLSGLLSGLLFAHDYYTGALAALLVVLLVGMPMLMSTVLEELRRAVGRSVASAGRAFAVTAEPLGRPNRLWLVVAALGTVAAALVFVHPIERSTIGPVSFSARDPWRPLCVGVLAAAWFAGRRWRLRARFGRAASVLWRGVAPASSALRVQLPRADSRFLMAFVVGGLAGLAIFLWIYLGSYLEHPAFPDEHLMNTLRQPDPAGWNDLRALVRDLQGYDTLRPFGLALALGLLVWAFHRRVDGKVRLYAVWLLFPSLLILVIPFRYGDVSFWKVLLGWLPGLSVIRAPWRIIYVYELGVVLATAFLLRRLPRRSARMAVPAIVLVLLLVDWNPWTFEFSRPRSAFNEWVLAPIEIDPSCRSFFIKGASERYMSRSPHRWSLYSTDAMFIALEHSIPTLNGYSAWRPADWSLDNPQESGYTAAVNRWIAKHDLRNVCQLDIDARTMTPYVSP